MAGSLADIDIIDVVGANTRSVRESRPFERRAALGTDDRRTIAAARESELAHRADGFFLERRKPAAERIQCMHFDALDRRGVEICELRGVDVSGNARGKRRG